MLSSLTARTLPEKRLKKWKRQWKIDLIETQNPEWNDLYETMIF